MDAAHALFTLSISRNNKQISMVGGKTMVEAKTMQMLSNFATIVNPLGPAPFPCMVSIEMDFNHSSLESEYQTVT